MPLNISLSAEQRSHAITRVSRRNILPVEPTRQSVLTSALIPADHVVKRGYPQFPEFVVRSRAVLSTDGSYVPDGSYPWEAVFTDAHTRFIAQDNQVNDFANTWSPFYSAGVDYRFTWSGLITPRLEEVEYRLGKLLYPMNSIRVVEEASLVSSFNSGLDDAASFMIAMAGIINSSEYASLMRVGDTMGDSIEISVDEQFYIRNQYGTATLKPTLHPAKMIPFYMVLVNDPSQTELNVATGTSRIHRAVIPNQDSARSLNIWIGEDLLGVKTLDINIFEFTVFPYAYGGPMTATQIITAMADIYGSNS